MQRKIVFCLLATVFLAISCLAQAQQPAKIPRIGLLFVPTHSTSSARIEAFRQGLRELGHVEGNNISFEYRFAEGKFERLPALAAELVRLKVDIIVTSASAATLSSMKATKTIPIVMTVDSDPVGSGHVASLARPGGNITGLSTLAPEISGKRLELLKEMVPRLSGVAVLGVSHNPGNAQQLREVELAAESLKVKLHHIDIRDPMDIEIGFGAVDKRHADAVLTLVSSVLNSHRSQIIKLATKSRLPAIYYAAEWVEDGGLMAYGVSFIDNFRRAATYVDKILKGRKPADLPVEQPMKFEFIVNLKAAKQIGLTIPPNLLVRADKVIR